MFEIGTSLESSQQQPSPQLEDPSHTDNGIDCSSAAECANCDCQLFYQSCVRKRLAVEFNELGQPIGANARTLARSIGNISRNGKFAPISYIHWKMVPDQKKGEMLKAIEEKFEFNVDKGKTWILERVGHCWRDWMAHLKARYMDPYDTYEEKLAAYDKIVIPGLKRPRLHCDSLECLFARLNKGAHLDQELLQQPCSPDAGSIAQPTGSEAIVMTEVDRTESSDAVRLEDMMERLVDLAADLEATRDKLVTTGSPMRKVAKIEEMINRVEGMKKTLASNRNNTSMLDNINHGDIEEGMPCCTQTDAADGTYRHG